MVISEMVVSQLVTSVTTPFNSIGSFNRSQFSILFDSFGAEPCAYAKVICGIGLSDSKPSTLIAIASLDFPNVWLLV